MSDVTETRPPEAELSAMENSVGQNIDVDNADLDSADADNAERDDVDASTSTQLEEEGDVAADYIEELLDITDLDGDLEIDARSGRVYLSITSSADTNLRLLSRPDAVNALQELTRIAVQAKTGLFSRLILDIAGSREARIAELALLVDKAVERIEAGSDSAALPPMSSYERKLVHDIVAERGFSSESKSEGRDRHTVITRV